ncbi:carboxypeptidase regulatory-like domain-containing protein [Natrialba chahannaoensis]|nr:carboxypeptidase regulatory-like domain-containing protein [Natrialba chahannaoensis]
MVAIGSPVAASDHAEVEIDDQRTDATSNHNWTITVQAEDADDIDAIELNYTYSNVDISSIENLAVTINEGEPVELDFIDASSDTVDIHLNESTPIKQNETVEISSLGEEFQHPSEGELGWGHLTLVHNDNGTWSGIDDGGDEILIGGTVSGTVTDTNGTSLEGGEVHIYDGLENTSVGDTAIVESDGTYEAVVADETYEVLVDVDGYVDGFVPETTVNAGETVEHNFELDEEGYLSGSVTDINGTLLDDGNVTVVDDPDDPQIHEVAAISNGTYNVPIAPGTYYVEADSDNYVSSDADDVVVNPGETTNQDFSLQETGFIAGTVTDSANEPIDSGYVQVHDIWEHVEIDEDGTYNMSVAPDTYTVEAGSDGYVTEYSDNVSVEVGTTTELNVSLTEAGFIVGTVSDPDGNPIDSGEVHAYDEGHENTGWNGLSEDDDGQFNFSVPEGTYTIQADSDGYGSVSHGGLEVTTGEQTVQNVTLEPAGHFDVTVTDPDGNLIPDANIDMYDPDESIWQGDVTDENGSATISIPDGTYDVEVRADGYAPTRLEDVSVSVGEVVTQTIELEVASTIQGTVTDADGNPVDGAEVFAHDDGYQHVEFDETDADGEYSVVVPEGEYTLRIDADGYGPEIVDGVETNAGQTETRNVELDVPAVITGTVSDDDGTPVDKGVVVATDGSDYYWDEIDPSDNGSYSLELSEGTYSVEAFTDGAMARSDGELTLNDGESISLDLGMVDPTIHEASVEHVGDGPEPDMDAFEVGTMVHNGFMQVQLLESGGELGHPSDLEPYNVTETTELEITLTVEDYDPNSLLWGAKDVSWEAEANESMAGNVTDITVTTKPVNLQGFDDPDVPIGPVEEYERIEWPEGEDDQAEFGWNQTVYFGLFDFSNVPNDVAAHLDGMTITTNAQTFSRPEMTDDSLEIYVGAPQRTVQGDQHDGFYEAFIPNDLLDEWDVDDPADDLDALWKGESSAFTVTETNDGAWIEIDITYSAGTLSVSPADTADDDDDSNGGSGSSGTGSSSSTDDDDADEAETDEEDTEETDGETDEEDTEETDGETDEEDTEETDGETDQDDAEETDGETDEEETAEMTDEAETQPDDGDDETETADSTDDMPGFGPVVALLAILFVGYRFRTG